ncbi:hypothetical protein FUT69_09700 [Xylella taiwanensis]|nr:hypothetical protein [Xylella taiwanensis]MCD8456027.1 class I SAM-dependent methyltransferase [Xylella taiwanensis]MCD8458431.1 class I SAM-dependent methyltransferase [Xylella taiwanensis]MCD8460567.1 class I SAM-dependent methyltransferase [Xylella taiwanensis]MCD8463371.1 class I SAM-dependent methyltransferase [Xylella taiwanensis]MCD8465072.1 class I SAM-dependent methyltransferase [Xylella taiwanensis]
MFWTAPLHGDHDVLGVLGGVGSSTLDSGGCFFSQPCLFVWHRVDLTSVLLVEYLPTGCMGRVVSLGAGREY